MSFILKPDEVPSKALARIAGQQVDRCLASMRGGADAGRSVHDARKSMKRLRALLRLLRSGLGDRTWRQENARLREIGGRLGGFRERDVLPATIDALAATADTPTAAVLMSVRAHCSALAGAVGKADQAGRERKPSRPKAIAEAARRLDEARHHLAGCVIGLDWDHILATGLADTHRSARKRLAVAAASTDDEDLHELRKSVQTHWRQMQLLEDVWPEVVGAREKAARELSQMLGDHHDLSVLASRIDAMGAGSIPRAGDRALVLAVCREKQAGLRSKALHEATRLFAARPKAFAAEMVTLWQLAARDAGSQGRSVPEEAPPREARTSKRAAAGTSG